MAVVLIIAGVAFAALPTVKSHQKISDDVGGLEDDVDAGDQFGWAVEGVGDLDGDDIEDIIVGAPLDDEGGLNSGSLFVLFMNTAARVDSNRKINEVRGNFAGEIRPGDEFGTAVTSLGDLDGDGYTDLAVGTPRNDDGNDNAGAVWILFLNDEGTVSDEQKISDTTGDFDGQLVDGDLFGYSVASLGDLDGDGIGDLAVGAPLDDDGDDADNGAVWILFLHDNGRVRDFQKISEEAGRFQGPLSENDVFGNSVAALGDVDGDDIVDIAVGAPQDDDGNGEDNGAVWILFLNDDGTVKAQQKISEAEGGLPDVLSEGDLFGWSVAALGDLDGDGIPDLGVGSPLDDDGGGDDQGAIYQIALNADGTVKELQKISASQGGFTGEMDDGDTFGTSLARAGDLDDDGAGDLVVGVPLQDDGPGVDNGAIFNLLMAGPAVSDCGDANDDGVVNTTDALFALRTSTGLETCEICRCDVNSSGGITAPDAQRILTFAVGTEVELTCTACS